MPQHAKKPRSKQTVTKSTEKTESKKLTPPPDPNDPVAKALDAFIHAEDGVIEAAVGAYIKRTDKVDNQQLLGDDTHGLKGSGSHESALQATAYGRAEAVELAGQYAILVEAGLVVGGSIKLSGSLEAKYGPLVVKAGAKLSLFGGVMAKATGRAQIGDEGIVLQGTAKAFAGAQGKGSVDTSFDIGDLGLGAEIEAEGKAGAWGEAEGELSFSKESVAIYGTAKAFAGVEGSVSGSTTARLYGRETFKVKGTLTGQAGVGGEVGGGFKIRGGKIEMKLDAKGTLGLGGGGDVDIVTDLKPVAVWAWRTADKVKWSMRTDGKAKCILDDPSQIVAPLTAKVEKYAQRKIDGLHSRKATSFVKIEKLQAYVGELVPYKKVKNHTNAAAVDAAIKEAVEAALCAKTKAQDIKVTVTNGKLVKIDNLPEPDVLAAQFTVKSKTGEALSSIVSTA